MMPDDNDLTESLKNGIDRMMGEVEVPAGLASRARWHRSQERKFRTVLGSTAATLAVIGLLAGTLAVAPPQLPRAAGTPGVLTVAYVTSQVDQALTAASTARLVEQVQATAQGANFQVLVQTRAGGHRQSNDLISSRTSFWLYKGQSRLRGLASSGAPLFDLQSRAGAGKAKTTGVGVDYHTKTWWQSSGTAAGSGPARPSCANAADFTPVRATPADWPLVIRTLLKCGTYKVVQHQTIDGIPAIKLAPRSHDRFAFTQTLWVARSTFLPMRVDWSWTIGVGGHKHGGMQADFTWSKPTKASLAGLRTPIPAGFRKVGFAASSDPITVIRLG